MIRGTATLWVLLLATPVAAESPLRFGGDKRLECEYEKLQWKRVFLVGQFTEPKTDPCVKHPWTLDGERLWRSHLATVERYDHCNTELWQRRLALAGGGGLMAMVGTFTVRQVRRNRSDGSILAIAAVGGMFVGGLFAWLTGRPCPSLPIPEWAR